MSEVACFLIECTPHTRDRIVHVGTEMEQTVQEHLWRRVGETDVFTLNEAPIGAMWDSDWYEGFRPPGPDGKWMTVRLPSGEDWCIDLPASSGGGGWHRDGVPPNLTVRPSIQSPNYHGFLIAGVLRSC